MVFFFIFKKYFYAIGVSPAELRLLNLQNTAFSKQISFTLFLKNKLPISLNLLQGLGLW